MKTRRPSFNISLVTLGLTFVLFLNISKTNAQGANAPEAASFEPVDATDMVNLVTGNLSYVLPLLNIPSPEGGYPISLSYHAGIAMEQEASWVGLGWSINPGSINRAVNGYPDDWGETNYSEFFYDNGWTENYYGLSLGVQATDAVSVGLGLSWGSNQSLGGFVSASLGLGKDGKSGSVGFRVGTNGVSINGSLANGFSASLGTSGVGIGYSHKKSGIGVNLNWSPSNGIAGGFSLTQSTGRKGTTLNGASYNKTASLGINFSSNSTSINGSANGFGAGITNYTNSDGGEYDVNISSTSFNIPIYMFYIGWSHTKIQRSLFKFDNLYTSGMLYPVEANKSQSDQVLAFSNKMEENHFMDINVIQPFSKSSIADDLIDEANKNDRNNLILPNYDNYNVSAQGLSGTLNPYTYKELILSARGRGEQNNDNKYVTYLNKSHDFYTSIAGATGSTPNEIDKKYFTFSNAYNSYLKLNRSNFSNQNSNSSYSENLLSKYITSDNNSNGFLNGKRKKEGNHITTFTNKEIRQGNLNGFIEAKEESSSSNLLDRNNIEVFLDEGIGAYQITTMDGKTYHYSLPVYQFESYYKNYPSHKPNGQQNNSEDDNFFEIQKTTPYATHWLLTAITGPDYYDKNENGKVDEADYGYWVEFDYGKWSDGFIWETPREEVVDENDNTKKTTSYSWGRKQMYYLDAVKTRTHTALFVKDIRNDNKGISKNISKKPWDGLENFSAQHFEFVKKEAKTRTAFFANDIIYNLDGTSNYISSSGVYEYNLGRGIFYESGEERSLKLKKIILLKNKTISKNRGNLMNSMKGYSSYNSFYMDLTKVLSAYNNNDYMFKPFKINVFNLHQDKNVLDVKDIENLNLESQAVQVIDFEHDYSLADKAPNTDTGRLTLKSVNFKGKQGVQVVPPYKFEYDTPWRDYNKDDIDAWGYHKTNPETWSLNKIITPTGGQIKIDYGKDAYLNEGVKQEEKINRMIYGVSTTDTDHCNYDDLTLTFRDENSTVFTQNGFTYYEPVQYFDQGSFYRILFRNLPFNSDVEMNFEVLSINNLEMKIRLSENLQVCASTLYSYRDDIFLYGQLVNDYRVTDDPIKGRYGGGITTKSITINDGFKNIATTEYVYKNGITSYAPSKEPKGVPYVSELPAPMVLYGEVEMNTKDGNGTHLGSTVYEFETLKPRKEEVGYIFSLGEAFRVKENQDYAFENGKVIANKYTIESSLGNIGRLKSVKSYNSESHLLNKTENHYKTNFDAVGEIGVTQESFTSYKRFQKDKNNDNDVNDPDEETFYISATSKINYPSVLESVTSSQGNFDVTKYFDKHDILTGQVLETRTYASDGIAFKSKIVPAYTKYSEMGSKIDNPNNFNMLTQSAMSKTYLKEGANWKEIGANITTWNNNWQYWDYEGVEQTTQQDKGSDIWRKHKSYIWKGAIDSDGIYTSFTGEDDNFEWGVGAAQTDANWQQVSETTMYDHYSMTLENKDVNGNYASTKTGDKNSKVLAVSNAAYTEMFYSGAEYIVEDEEGASLGYFDGEVKFLGTQKASTKFDKSHTGNYYIQVTQGVHAFEVKIPARTERNTTRKQIFKVSVWVRTSQKDNVGIKVNGGTIQSFNTNETMSAGDWSLLNGYVNLANSSIPNTIAVTSTSGIVDLDDFRLHPITSSMTSYVYNEWDEVSYITGANGLSTQYIYDKAGRLKETKVEVLDLVLNPVNDEDKGGFKTVSKNSYNYKIN